MNFVGVELVMAVLVLPANNVVLDILDIFFGKSLIYKRKR
jgi:hypothetical protein